MEHQDASQPRTRTGIFISHAHEDAELANSLRQLLQLALGLDSNDITCTNDANYGLTFGKNLQDEIDARLTGAKAVFLLATRRSKGKAWVQYECGVSAAARKAGQLQFYVLTPTSEERDAVPEPYGDLVSVSMSDGRETWALVKQLRETLGQMTAADVGTSTSALLELQGRCAKLERLAIDERHRIDGRHARRLMMIAVAGSWAVAASGLMALSWHFTEQQATIKAAHAVELQVREAESIRKESEQTRKLQVAHDAEIYGIPFSGFFRQGQKLLFCSKVEAQLDSLKVETECGADGVFVFNGSQLRADPSARIPLNVKFGADQKFFRTVVDRSSAPVAINLSGDK